MAKIKRIKVENKEFKDKIVGKNYASVLIFAMKNSPVNGLTIQDMRDLQKDLDEIEEKPDDSILEIEEKVFKRVVENIQNTPWKVYNKELVEMDDYFTSLIED